jgi:ubiquinone/menaquinone biosynthesis C-methylase UbiE
MINNEIEYDGYAKFWEMIYRNKEDDFPFYHSLAKKYGNPILDIGCGTARMGLLLAKGKYEVYNLDISKEMLALGKTKAQAYNPNLTNHHFVNQDMRSFKIDKKFRLIISTFSTMFSLKTIEDFEEVTNSVAVHLLKGGVFAFDVTFFGKGKYKAWGARTVEDNSPRLMKVVDDPNESNKKWIYTRIVDVNEKKHTRKIIAFFDGVKNSMVEERRIFELTNIYLSPDEIRMVLKRSGFKNIKILGGFDMKPLYHPSYKEKQRQIIIASI